MIVIFQDNFENGLGNWVGKDNKYSAKIVIDPKNPNNKVLTFAATTGYGDAFSLEISKPLRNNLIYYLSFDYLGTPVPNYPNNLGGFIGWSSSTPFSEGFSSLWVAGTQCNYLKIQKCISDTGTWQHYDLILSDTPDKVRIVIEDFASTTTPSKPGDVFFDNISVVSLEAAEFTINSYSKLLDELRAAKQSLSDAQNELESHKKAFYITKVGQKEVIAVTKNFKVNQEITVGTDFEKCQNIILGFTPISRDNIEDTININQFGCTSKQQVSFKTIIGQGDTAISAIQIQGQEDYIACVYNFDADSFEFNDLLAQDLIILEEQGQCYENE